MFRDLTLRLVLTLALALFLGCEEGPPGSEAGAGGGAGSGAAGGGGAGGVGAHGGSGGAGAHGGAGGGGAGGAGATGGTGGAGATGGTGGTGGAGAAGGSGGTGGSGGVGGGIFESQKMRVRFKGPYRLQLDLERLLELPAEEVCRELGLFDCVGVIHGISLGGVEAYNANIYKAPDGTSISAPMIVERIALAACDRRFELDRQAPPDAVVLFELASLEQDRLADVSAPEVGDAVQRLFRVLLQRDATPDEAAGVRALYRDIERHADARSPASEWGVLTCMSILTSVEYLFY